MKNAIQNDIEDMLVLMKMVQEEKELPESMRLAAVAVEAALRNFLKELFKCMLQ